MFRYFTCAKLDYEFPIYSYPSLLAPESSRRKRRRRRRRRRRRIRIRRRKYRVFNTRPSIY